MTTEIKERIRDRISNVIGYDIGKVYPEFFLPGDRGQTVVEKRVVNLKLGAAAEAKLAGVDFGQYVEMSVIGWKREISGAALKFVTIRPAARDFGGVFILN